MSCGGFGRIGAGGAEHRAAAQGMVLDVIDGQPADEFAIALHEPLKPSRTPKTSMPLLMASMVTALMTPLMPGAGPPPDQQCQSSDTVVLVHKNDSPLICSFMGQERATSRGAVAAGFSLRHYHRRLKPAATDVASTYLPLPVSCPWPWPDDR